MADPPPSRDADDGTDNEPDRESTPGTPRWVKVFGIVCLILILLFVVMVFAGGGHGPGRHTASGKAGGDTQTSSVAVDPTPSGVDPADHALLEGGRG
jgi:hypothetical protein